MPVRPDLDEAHPRAGLLGLAACYFGDRGLAEDLAQRRDSLGPDAACLVGLLTDLAVEGLDDLEHGDLIGRAGERVAPFHAAVAGQQRRPAQGREELLEELLWDATTLGQLLDRHRPIARASELGHRDDGVARLGGDGNHKVLSTARRGPGWVRIDWSRASAHNAL